MWTPSARVSLLAAALALGPGCDSSGVRLPVQLLTRSCSGPQPLDGATHLRLRVTGEGMEPLEQLVPLEATPEALEQVPAGRARVLEVRAYERRPAEGGRVVALGRSAPFDVAAAGTAPSVRVTLRRSNAFTPVGLPEQPETCAALATARAGHSATLLPDGRVLLAGGFALQEDAPLPLSSAELYSPGTGALAPAPELAVAGEPSARAFHTATLLPSGQVLLAGGEEVRGARADALLFAPAQGTYELQPLQRPRTQHAAAVDAAGRVLLVGGVDGTGATVTEAEGLSPAEGRALPVAVALPRAGAALLPLPDGQTFAVVGGGDGSALEAEVPLLRFEADAFRPAGAPLRLLQPRRRAAVVPSASAEPALVLGGFGPPVDPTLPGPALATSELLPLTPGAQASPGANVGARADLCAVRLPDGRVLTVGGRGAPAGEPPQSSNAAELLVPPAPALGTQLPVVLGMPRLAVGRWAHTCTLLPDGTVLVAGGLREERGEAGPVREVLSELLLFTPAPLD